jgi:hypothetical protein
MFIVVLFFFPTVPIPLILAQLPQMQPHGQGPADSHDEAQQTHVKEDYYHIAQNFPQLLT